MVDVTCSLRDSLRHFLHALRFPTRVHLCAKHLRRTDRAMQRFNNKSLNWPAWFKHFRAVADVHGWDKNQRAQQLVSYLDEMAMNVAQDDELYDYDILVKLLGDRFDPVSRVSHPGLDFMAGYCVITRMQTPSPMPLQDYAGLATHRARRSSARS